MRSVFAEKSLSLQNGGKRQIRLLNGLLRFPVCPCGREPSEEIVVALLAKEDSKMWIRGT